MSEQHAGEGTPLDGLYRRWFLEYASYVILDRAVPYVEDGLKPVQRRLLHALDDLDDNRFHKVANVIGHTMRYHPHGDSSIYEALVRLGQKELLVETQGNWGNVATGDPAAASRYIETRLSTFAKAILLSPSITNWQMSYDGRAREPVTFPVKFPLLLSQGADGIAVGLTTKILPHNFVELVRAAIDHLRGKKVNLVPDFPTGGIMDAGDYAGGARGGKVRVRAEIKIVDKKTLAITAIPFSTTTTSVIESILNAAEKGKIKIKKVDDNTARDVEIAVHLPPGIAIDKTIDALYAFTECEVSISTNCCVILEHKPFFTNVNEVLRMSTEQTVDILRREQEFQLGEHLEKLHFSLLERLFIEKKIYRRIEGAASWEEVLRQIRDGVIPYAKELPRAITDADILRLTEIKIKRISKFDGDQAEATLKNIRTEIAGTKKNLAEIRDFTQAYFRGILERFGNGRERRTQIATFGSVKAANVAIATLKLYVDRAGGFVGKSLRGGELVADCSDLDDVLTVRRDGKCSVIQMPEKTFVGSNIVHVSLYKKGDENLTFHLLYRDGPAGAIFAKRFTLPSVIRGRDYDLTAGAAGSEIVYLSANPKGEAETVALEMQPKARSRKSKNRVSVNFGELPIRARDSKGIQVADDAPVVSCERASYGPSTLASAEYWYDPHHRVLNTTSVGLYIGALRPDDRILAVYRSGFLEVAACDTARHFMADTVLIERFAPDGIVTVMYFDGARQASFVKRIVLGADMASEKVELMSPSDGSKLFIATTIAAPRVRVHYARNKEGIKSEEVDLTTFEIVKSPKAVGKKISELAVRAVELLVDDGDSDGPAARSRPAKK